jgi:hypothetical protein
MMHRQQRATESDSSGGGCIYNSSFQVIKEARQYSNAIHKETGSANQRQSLRLPNKAPKAMLVRFVQKEKVLYPASSTAVET